MKARQRKRKSNATKLSTKQAIFRYKEKYPDASVAEIADKFNITYQQAIYAVRQGRAGKLHRTQPRVRVVNLEKLMREKSSEDLLDEQFHHTIAQLAADKKMAVDERTTLLEKLFFMRKILQQVRLQNHIKRTDAGVISVIVRKFNPDISDDDIIKIYKEAVGEWAKAEQ